MRLREPITVAPARRARGGPRFAVKSTDGRKKVIGTCICGKRLRAAGVFNHQRACVLANSTHGPTFSRPEWLAFEANLW